MTLRAPRPGLRRALAKRDAEPTATHVGVEHEYSVWSDERWLDARDLFDRHPPPGVRIHPTEPCRFLLDSGITLHADDHVAEVAVPPVEATRGFTHELRAWAELGHAELIAALPSDVEIRGESTHVSVSMSDRLNESAALLYAQTFAPAAMLLMDLASSPGLLVRPRPGRLELCGEFVSGAALRVVALFALGSARACSVALESGDLTRLPPALELELEPGRLRFGWYVDRAAFGVDLYAQLRAARLATIDGRELSADEDMRSSVEVALSHLSDVAPAERELLRQVANGDLPLPAEGELSIDDLVHPPSPSTYSGLAKPLVRDGLTFETVTSTWEFTAFKVSNGHSAIVPVPAERLESFRATLVTDGSTQSWQEVIEAAADAPVLRTLDQARSGRVFKDIEPSAELLPTDYMGVGNGSIARVPSAGRLLAGSSVARSFAGSSTVVSQVSIASDTNEVKGTKPKKPCLPGWAAAVLIALPTIAGVLTATLVGGGEAPVTAAQPTTAASPSAVTSPTSSGASPAPTSPPAQTGSVASLVESAVNFDFRDAALSGALIPAEGVEVFDFSGQVISDGSNWYEEAVPEAIFAADASLPARDLRDIINCNGRGVVCSPQFRPSGPGIADITMLGWLSSGPIIRAAPDGGSWFFNFSFDTPAPNAPPSEQGFAGADCFTFIDPTGGNFLFDRWNRSAGEPQQVQGPAAAVFSNKGVMMVFSAGHHPCSRANGMTTTTFAFDQGQNPTGMSFTSPEQGEYQVRDRPTLTSIVSSPLPSPDATSVVSSPQPTAAPSGAPVATTTGGGFPYWVLIVTGLALSAWGAVMISEDCWQRRKRLGL